jgi:hypothetical protein
LFDDRQRLCPQDKTIPLQPRRYMSAHYSSRLLKMIRNQIPIEKVITRFLKMDVRYTRKWLRFRCPQCYCFHTATNHKTNLARCFDCKKNFNPIDLVIAVGKCDFIEAVEYLRSKLS